MRSLRKNVVLAQHCQLLRSSCTMLHCIHDAHCTCKNNDKTVEQSTKACILLVHMTKNKRLNITRNWYSNPNVRPKLFNATLERHADGSYRVVEAVVEAVVNQHESRIQRVDARDFSRSLRNSRVYAL